MDAQARRRVRREAYEEYVRRYRQLQRLPAGDPGQAAARRAVAAAEARWRALYQDGPAAPASPPAAGESAAPTAGAG
jgi:hypothetical protein